MVSERRLEETLANQRQRASERLEMEASDGVSGLEATPSAHYSLFFFFLRRPVNMLGYEDDGRWWWGWH